MLLPVCLKQIFAKREWLFLWWGLSGHFVSESDDVPIGEINTQLINYCIRYPLSREYDKRYLFSVSSKSAAFIRCWACCTGFGHQPITCFLNIQLRQNDNRIINCVSQLHNRCLHIVIHEKAAVFIEVNFSFAIKECPRFDKLTHVRGCVPHPSALSLIVPTSSAGKLNIQSGCEGVGCGEGVFAPFSVFTQVHSLTQVEVSRSGQAVDIALCSTWTL